ncbi:MAG: hypothetical protein WEB93_01210, partial [Sphingomonadales bacterium]
RCDMRLKRKIDDEKRLRKEQHYAAWRGGHGHRRDDRRTPFAEWPKSPATNRVPTCKNAVDQVRDGSVELGLTIVACIIRMRRSGIAQNADNLMFRQDVAVVQREQQRLADREGCRSGNVWDLGHRANLLQMRGTTAELCFASSLRLIIASPSDPELSQISVSAETGTRRRLGGYLIENTSQDVSGSFSFDSHSMPICAQTRGVRGAVWR